METRNTPHHSYYIDTSHSDEQSQHSDGKKSSFKKSYSPFANDKPLKKKSVKFLEDSDYVHVKKTKLPFGYSVINHEILTESVISDINDKRIRKNNSKNGNFEERGRNLLPLGHFLKTTSNLHKYDKCQCRDGDNVLKE